MQIRGIVLPEREERSFWIDGDVLRTSPASDADLVVDGGWLLPGLVDAHAHPGSDGPPGGLEDGLLRRHLTQHRDDGVLLVRTPGTADRIPDWVAADEDLPRVRSAGRWLTTPGRFFPDYGREVGEAGLAAAAVDEALASSGWCKVIGDWKPADGAVPLEHLTAVVEAVHAVGGRVAVHCQTAEGCHNAVMAGADSLEHGMHLDPVLLDRMVAQGTALVPTISVFAEHADEIRAAAPSRNRDWWLSGWEDLLPTVRAAHDAGVTLLAGTDSFGFAPITREIEWLVKAGVAVDDAIGAASWTAREYLGLPGLVDGAPADVTVYDDDPTTNPETLTRPRRIILRGRIVC